MEDIGSVYKTPKSSDIRDFLSQTQGRITNDIRIFLGKKSDPNCKIRYTGPLSIAHSIPQYCGIENILSKIIYWDIIADISDNNISDIIYTSPVIETPYIKK